MLHWTPASNSGLVISGAVVARERFNAEFLGVGGPAGSSESVCGARSDQWPAAWAAPATWAESCAMTGFVRKGRSGGGASAQEHARHEEANTGDAAPEDGGEQPVAQVLVVLHLGRPRKDQ